MSSPISRLADHYEIVVVGSGYGGGIAASRLARAGREVCLLERGRERWPGDFPDTSNDALRELRVVTKDADHGPATGLYVLHTGGDISVLSGCGLGGTSLINANVAMKVDARVFQQPAWPEPIRDDEGDLLAEAQCRAWTMLNPSKLPDPKDPKVAALEYAAQQTGRGTHFKLTDITVAFDDGLNAAGVHQPGCTRCGDCCSGCNVGAKTTTMLTYVADAYAHGASIFTEVSVHHLSRRPDGRWLVHLDYLGVGREHFGGPLATISADVVVLAGGVLGSTELLKRSECDGGLAFSSKLGTAFSGNGDALAFAYDTERTVRGVGWGHETHVGDPTRHVGPCITGVIDERLDAQPFQKGRVVEEGAIPGALAAGMPAALAIAAKFESMPTREGPLGGLHVSDLLESFTPGGSTGALDKTVTYLVMGHDDSGGEVVLENDRLRVHWPHVADQVTYKETDALLDQLTKPLGGRYVPDPIWSERLTRRGKAAQKVPWLRRLMWHPKVRAARQLGPLARHEEKDHFAVVTVHPLGGCPMGESGATGVVDHRSRVFSGSSGDAFHKGLYVMDGSIVPTSLGCNPLLTISILAERACALMCEERAWSPLDPHPPRVTTAVEFPEPPAGVEFTEKMMGSLRVGADELPISFVITVQVDDVDALIADPSRPQGVAGTVSLPSECRSPLTVIDGEFRLFVRASRASEIEQMRYELPLVAPDGRKWLLVGAKTIGARSFVHAWHETTTLSIRVNEGRDGSGPLVGTGEMRVAPADFAHQMRTMRGTGGSGEAARRQAVDRYVARFSADLAGHYLGPLAPDRLRSPDRPARRRRPLTAPEPVPYDVATKDGLTIRLLRFRPAHPTKGPVLLAHGMGVSSEMFWTDLIDVNLVEYLTEHGYDVWAVDLRVSIALPSALWESSADAVARYDHPAAVASILQITGAPNLQAVVHCYGSNTFVMSVLKGWTPTSSLRSVVCSQVAMHLDVGTVAKFKGGLHTAGLLERFGIETLTAYVDANANWRSRLFDEALRFQGFPAEERCHSAVCHRVTFLFSRLYNHANLTQRMHDDLHELFGVANLRGLEQLSSMVRHHGHVVDEHGGNTYLTPENLHRLALPMLFISGGDNQCYHPSSTAKSRDLLATANPNDQYDRVVIPGYGHIDCMFGADAVHDVYPSILAHLDAH